MIKIRKYQHQDKTFLVDLWKKVFPDAPAHNEPSRMLDEKLAIDDMIFIAEVNGAIVGACMAGYDGHRGWLYAVAVLPEFRRKYIGTQLVEFAMQALKTKGCKKVNLQIRSTNTKVASFYQSLGFAAEDRMSMGAFIK